MELRGTPVSVHNVHGNFAGRAHRDCEGALPPIVPAISRLTMPAGHPESFSDGCKRILALREPLLARRLRKLSAVWPCIFR